MADSLFLDEVVGFLHFDESGSELINSLDKEDDAALLSDTELDLQLLGATTVDDLIYLDDPIDAVNQNRGRTAIDSDCTSVECESIGSASSPNHAVVIENIRSGDALRRSSHRQKQKAQKDALYLQANELSTKLTAMLKKKEAAKTKQGLGLGLSAVWKALSRRHLQARLIAEEQHSRLRKAIQKQSALIENLGMMIHKRIGEDQTHQDQRPTKKARSESPDAVLYGAYLQELDEVYAGVDDVFKETTVKSSDNPYVRFTPSLSTCSDANYHEVVGKVTTPFSFDRVRKIIRSLQCVMENRQDTQVIYREPGLSASTSIAKARIPGPADIVPACSLVQHAVVRKYYESERVVIICRKFTEGEGAFDGMHSDKTGWSIYVGFVERYS
ncbi:hypothetical protein BBO99_00009042 [Phytophthora kernoviae]|uniref:Uncharacterized protein n=1 Tax=Phytophthora kernoviae TaxID=325452 RepID=A0A3R7K5D6_9STRA|nr:hypothetical protein JM16_009010 [Phytophthora kernoviae]RLN20707.1 hypothetical protein BBI17_009060 [Phytophthora kernoviae]RLN74192.1 hypothetical protein BBO99_00009042 [Phytophthora kernoviae]